MWKPGAEHACMRGLDLLWAVASVGKRMGGVKVNEQALHGHRGWALACMKWKEKAGQRREGEKKKRAAMLAFRCWA